MKILVSACLLGFDCKYNGKNNLREGLVDRFPNAEFIPLCAEQLGGLPTPRVPAEIVVVGSERRVLNKDGEDVTNNFVNGARQIVEYCKANGIGLALLKSKSPSCGKGLIYDGSFSGILVEGNGILTQMLLDEGIEVISID